MDGLLCLYNISFFFFFSSSFLYYLQGSIKKQKQCHIFRLLNPRDSIPNQHITIVLMQRERTLDTAICTTP